jgi:hypothetical protein
MAQRPWWSPGGGRSPFGGEEGALSELAAFGMALPWFALLPRGDGHPVLVIPGFRGNDSSTVPLRSVLTWLGYDVAGWGQGVNRGPDEETLRTLNARFEDVYGRRGQPVSLIGWSLGGVYARGLARRAPDRVRQVITLGSPFRRFESSRRIGTPQVPVTSIWSRSDPIVDYRNALEEPGPRVENIEVRGTHLGLGHNPAVVLAVADRLAQPAGAWKPFTPSPVARSLYP